MPIGIRESWPIIVANTSKAVWLNSQWSTHYMKVTSYCAPPFRPPPPTPTPLNCVYQMISHATPHSYPQMPGFKVAVEAWSETEDLDAIIGLLCSVVCEPVGLLAASWNIPLVAAFCSSGILSNKAIYPTFSRMDANFLDLGPASIAATVDRFG